MPKYALPTAQKMKFSIKDFFSKFPADLVTFTEEILNGKLNFLCCELLIFVNLRLKHSGYLSKDRT